MECRLRREANAETPFLKSRKHRLIQRHRFSLCIRADERDLRTEVHVGNISLLSQSERDLLGKSCCAEINAMEGGGAAGTFLSV